MDKTKIFEAAGKFAARGQADKAAKEYVRILAEDPKDVRALQKLAELYQKTDRTREAVELLLRVAQGYGEQGFFLKAVAVYKQILKLDSNRIEVNLELAQIYQHLGLIGDATQQFQLVASHHDRNGNVRESLSALRRLVDLDPENVDSRRNLAELYARERLVTEAVAELRRAAAYLERNNRGEEYLLVQERITQLLPDDAGTAREVAKLLIGAGECRRALAQLQVCFRQNPRDVETLELLARAFSELGQAAKTVSIYRELAQLHAETGNVEARRRTLKSILQLVPDDPEAAEALSEGAEPEAVPAPPSSPEVPPRPVAPPRPALTPAASVGNPMAGVPPSVVKVLTETDVYLKYNLVAKAAEHIRTALDEAPEALPVREKYLAILDRQGKTAAAIDELARLIELARAQGATAAGSSYRQELGQRAPSHPLVADSAQAAELGPALADADLDDVVAAALAREAAPEGEHAEVAYFPRAAETPPEIDDAPRTSPATRRPPAPEEDLALDDEFVVVIEAEMDGEGVETDPELAPAPLVRPPPDVAGSARGGGTFADRAADDDDDVVVFEDDVDDDPRAELGLLVSAQDDEPLIEIDASGAPSRQPAPSGVDASRPSTILRPERPADASTDRDRFAEDLEEVEFLLSQGLTEDARAALEEILTQAPGHPGAHALSSQLQAPPTRGPAPSTLPARAAPGPDLGDEGGFDLARELADEFDISRTPRPRTAPEISVAGVLDGLRRPGESGAGEDAQTHYDLGIAFKEMGLHDEAIHEFEVAIRGRGRSRVVDCLTMIGVCRMEQGALREAIASFEGALRTPGLTLEASKEAHYELGRCHEQLDLEARALDHYSRVFKADPLFRDVKARVTRLAPRLRAKAGSGPGAHASPTGAAATQRPPAQPAGTTPPEGDAPPSPIGRGSGYH
jgi:tetratricopeptide (TPR) repeat protein